MGKKVSKLAIKKQNGSDNTYYASWDFIEPVIYAIAPGKIVKDCYVNFLDPVASNIFTNGTAVSKTDAADTWKVELVDGTRVLLGQNKSKKKTLNSWVSASLLYEVRSGSGISVLPIKNVKNYTVHWFYRTGNGVLFDGGSSSVTEKNATYSPPDNAISIVCRVTPVSTTYTEEIKTSDGKKEKVTKVTRSYWQGESVSKSVVLDGITPPETPSSAPTVSVSQYKITATVDSIDDSRCDVVEFYFLRNKTVHKTFRASVTAARASVTVTGEKGASYDIRYRGINKISSKHEIVGEWGPWSNSNATAPNKLSKMIAVKAASETSAYLKWGKVATATSYDIEYTDNKKYFDSSTAVSSVSVENIDHVYVTGLGQGSRYYFRVRAVNAAGVSPWTTGTYSVALGSTPAAPTAWSNKSTLGIGEALKLYWIQNSEDGSDQTNAELYTKTISGSTTKENTISLKSYIVNDADKNSVYTFDTSSIKADTTIQWKIRTAGITGKFGGWSAMNTVKIYVKPTVTVGGNGMSLDNITRFPIKMNIRSTPDSQTMIGCDVVITSKSTYTTTDEYGDVRTIRSGEVIFSKYYSQDKNNKHQIQVSLGVYDIDLENNRSYTVTCTAAFDSGLTAKDAANMYTNFADTAEYTDMSTVSINYTNISAMIRTRCINSNNVMPSDVVFSVYRKEFDGEFTLIQEGIKNGTTIHDMHPSLDIARYRVVCTNTKTGEFSYSDISEPVLEKSIVIQWKDQWSEFDDNGDDNGNPTAENIATSSMIKLPYNIDIADNYNPDTEMVEYTGRSHPVSYYGTQIGQTATWNVVIEYDDKDTLYQLRRLARWMGDVYVREPSGSGYWANVVVSFNQTHCELTIPVTLSITRVEGGA